MDKKLIIYLIVIFFSFTNISLADDAFSEVPRKDSAKFEFFKFWNKENSDKSILKKEKIKRLETRDDVNVSVWKKKFKFSDTKRQNSVQSVENNDAINKTPFYKKFLKVFKIKNKSSQKNSSESTVAAKTDISKQDELVWDDKISKENKDNSNKQYKKTSKKLEQVKEEKAINIQNAISMEETKSDVIVEGSVATNRIISIDDCIKMALANHPAIKSAMSSADIYKNKIAQAWSAYFPTFNLNATYSKNDMLIANFAFPNQKYALYNTPQLSGEMLLFDFGKTKAKADISKKTYESAQDNIQMSINDVIYNVKEAYYNLLFAIQQEKVYQDTVKDYELHLKQAKSYYNIGTKAKIDVMTAEYNLGKAKLNLIKAQNTVAMAYAQVNNAMGLPEFSNYSITESLESKAYKIYFDDLIKIAYETRPELLAAKKKAEASEVLVKASLRAFAPDIKAFGNYTLGGKTPAKDYGYQVGAGLSYSSTNLFLLKKQVDESKATYKRDLADYEKIKQNVYLEVKQSYIELHNAQQSIPVSRLSMNQAQEQYNLASGRYKVGLGDAIELKDAENTFRNAQLDYYNSLLNYSVSAANIERVIGTPVKPTDESLI